MNKKKTIIYLSIFIVALAITEFYGWAVWHQLNGGRRLGKIGEVVLDVATIPNKWLEQAEISAPLWEKNKTTQTENFVVKNGYADTGFILLTCYDNHEKQVVIKLFSLKDKKTIHQWKPDLSAIKKLERNSSRRLNPDAFKNTFFRTQHPWLTVDNGLIIKGEYGIIKLDKNSRIEWFVDGFFHHPTEPDADGNLWMGVVISPQKVNAGIYPSLRDDGIAKISASGKVLYIKSVAEMLIENGYQYLVGSVGVYEGDALHLNDIQPVLQTTAYWQQGDVFVSIRNKSTILLYRPSTAKIIWLQTGPWMNQHDISIIDSSRIAIFNNNAVRKGKIVLLAAKNNNCLIYDFSNRSIDSPYTTFFRNNNIATKSEGRFMLMKNGDIIAEETNYGRLIRGSNKEVLWTYMEILDNNNVSILGWTRYYEHLPY